MNKEQVGTTIKNQRKSKKLKQQEVSILTGISRNYISDIENGRYMPSVETLSKLAVCLDMDLNFLRMTEIQEQELNEEGEGTSVFP